MAGRIVAATEYLDTFVTGLRAQPGVLAASILTISVDEILKRVVWRTLTLLLMFARGGSYIEAALHLRG
jgi:hypothetical protein